MLAVIGGTGIYELAGMQVEQHLDGSTPFGQPSGQIVKGRLGGRALRSWRATAAATSGCRTSQLPRQHLRAQKRRRDADPRLFGGGQPGAGNRAGRPRHAQPVLRLDPGARARSFFGKGVAAHVSTAQPASANSIDWAAGQAAAMGIKLHRDVTYACVEGPRLGTRAESLFLRRRAASWWA